MNKPEEQLKALGIELPVPVKPVANYVTNLQVNNLLYLSGQAFSGEPTSVDIGKLGRDLTVDQGYQAARNAAVCVLATVKQALGDLSRVKRIVRVLGLVNATEVFESPSVIFSISKP